MKLRVIIPLGITILLAIVPFFWLKPGWMDLGGDSSRLYFYDPINYLKTFPIYGLAPDGFAGENASYYFIPFISFIAILKEFLQSSYLVITFFNSLQLTVSFASVYFIVLELLKGKNDGNKHSINTYLAASISGLFYTLSPILTPNGWDKAMFTHYQLFLNPLMFFLFLKYLNTKKRIFLLAVLLISFIFSPNISPSPAVFAFYPFAFMFFILFVLLVKKESPGIKNLIIFFVLFIMIHSFHLIPFIKNFFSSANSFNTAAFSDEGKFSRGLNYFVGVSKNTHLYYNILNLAQGGIGVTGFFEVLWFIFPLIFISGLLLEGKKKPDITFLLLSGVFITILFFVTGVITDVGFNFYKSLFNIPGFSMFRNYVGQFSYVFVFFYALVIGYAIYNIFCNLSFKKNYLITSFAFLLLIISSLSFLKGDMINLIINQYGKESVHVPIKMDRQFENSLNYIRGIPGDAKFLTLPFTEAGLQMFAGADGGAYQGPSAIGYLTGKKDFSGYLVMQPFSDEFLKMVRNKDYQGINILLSRLNIRYIFYNSDPYIFGENFPGLPYTYVNTYMPSDQKLYQEFIESLAVKKKIDFGENYHIYELASSYYLPHIFIADNVVLTNNLDRYVIPLTSENYDPRTVVVKNSDLPLNASFDYKVFVKNEDNFTIPSNEMSSALPVSSPIPRDVFTNFYQFLYLSSQITFASLDNEFDMRNEEKFLDIEKSLNSNHTNKTEWLSTLNNLESRMEKIITEVDNSVYKDSGQLLLKNLLIREEQEVNLEIENSKITNTDKKSVLNFADIIFSKLFRSLSLSTLFTKNTYSFKNVPSGEYNIFMKNNAIEKKDFQKIQTSLGKYNNADIKEIGQGWLSLGKMKIDDKDNSLSIFYPSYVSSVQKDTIEDIYKTYSFSHLITLAPSDGLLSYIKYIISKFDNWDKNSSYILSFDYLAQTSQIANMTNWKTYKLFIHVGEKDSDIFVAIIQTDNDPLQQIVDPSQIQNFSIKNFSLAKIHNPTIILKQTSLPKKNRHIPKITFTEINPTEYRIDIRNAEEPYTLVFLDAFSKDWKLYYLNSANRISNSDTTYFNGYVEENRSKNNILDKYFFATLGKTSIAEENHFMVNGYANGWYITQKDSNRKENYTLILEMTGEKIFYLSSILSLIGLTSCFILVCMLLFHNKFIRKLCHFH